MRAGTRLVLTEEIHAKLREHLFPGDGKEAAAILICNRFTGTRLKLLAKELILVPHEKCKTRTVNSITWPGEYLEKAIDAADPEQMSIILVHSHPGGYLGFSNVDDESDEQTIPALTQGVDVIHGSAIMISTGEMRARIYMDGVHCWPVDMVSVAGDDIRHWWGDSHTPSIPTIPFTSDMTARLKRLTVAVIGVSGTGSIVAEQVARLGFGEIILVDHDQLEEKNLNRILNSTLEDAKAGRSKVEMFACAIERIRGEAVARPIHKDICTREAVLEVANADVIFCCVDTYNARMIADRLASAFLIPLFDIGVKIPTHVDPEDGVRITDVSGRSDYVKPGGSTLYDRNIYTPELLRQEHLRQTNPAYYEDQLERGYISGLQEEAPAVLPLNMHTASLSVMEFITRCFMYREEANGKYAQVRLSLSAAEEDYRAESSFTKSNNPLLGNGIKKPLLGLPELEDN